MKILFNFILSLFILNSIYAQATPFAESDDYWCAYPLSYNIVVAKGGLVLRAEPSTTSKKLLTIPENTIIPVHYFDHEGETEFINGKEGNWQGAYYNGSYGFIFDAYLKDAEHLKTTSAYKSLKAKSMKITTMNTPFRKEASTYSEIMEYLCRDTDVIIAEYSKYQQLQANNSAGWIKVQHGSTYGYLYISFAKNNTSNTKNTTITGTKLF